MKFVIMIISWLGVLSLVLIFRQQAHAFSLNKLNTSEPVRIVMPAIIDEEVGSQLVRFFEDPLTPKNTIIYFKGYGGSSLEMMAVMNAMDDYQKKGGRIEAVIMAPTYSALAVIACQADVITMRNGSSLMFHPAGQYVEILGGLFSYRQQSGRPEHIQLQVKSFQVCVNKKIISNEDVDQILHGNMITLTKTDLGLEKSMEDDVGIQSFLFDVLQFFIMIFGSLYLFKLAVRIIKGELK